jgi:hypothetical protein
MENKKCSKCKIDKPLEDFSKNKKQADGLHSYCKVCHRKYRRISYLKNKEKEKSQVKDLWDKNLVSTYCSNCKKPLKRHRTNVAEEKHNFCDIKCTNKFYGKKTDPYNYLFNSIKKRAKVKKFEFNLTREFLKELMLFQDNKCAITGIPIEVVKQYDTSTLSKTASLDRIHNDKGYTIDNVRFTCLGINYMRNRRSSGELEELLDNIIKFYKS